jgi:hypothetical protein
MLPWALSLKDDDDILCVDCYKGRTAELYAEKERLKEEFRRTRSEEILASLKDAQQRFAKAR